MAAKYITYKEMIAKSQKKYRQSHAEKMNEIQRNYYARKIQDEGYLEKLRERAKLSYRRKKERLENKKNI